MLLTGLKLSYNSFSGAISSRIGRLSYLHSFVINGTQFSGTIPTEIGTLKKAEEFALHNNTLIVGPIPSEIGLLSNLKQEQSPARLDPSLPY